jgi:hypothetical protein
MDILMFMENCPIFVIYIIIQIVILIVDFVEMNFVRAFVHFWIGFIFFMTYKKELCTNKNLNLGINQGLMVLSFVFCQWFLVNWAFQINNMNTTLSSEIVSDEVKNEIAEREEHFLKKRLKIEENDYTLGNTKIPADIENKKNEIRVVDVEKYNLSRGQLIHLPDGEKRTIVGFKEGFMDIANNGKLKYTIIQVDKPFEDDYSHFVLKGKKMSLIELNNLFDKNNDLVEKIGIEKRQLNERKGKLNDNINLLEDEIGNLKKPDTEVENFETMEEYTKRKNELNRDLNNQKKFLETVNTDLENLDKLVIEITEENKKISTMRSKLVEKGESQEVNAVEDADKNAVTLSALQSRVDSIEVREKKKKEEEEAKCLIKVEDILKDNDYSLEIFKKDFFNDIKNKKKKAIKVARRIIDSNLSKEMIICNYLKRELTSDEIEAAEAELGLDPRIQVEEEIIEPFIGGLGFAKY